MRDERAGMVQTQVMEYLISSKCPQEQYAFIYMSLLDKLKEVLKILEYKNEAYVLKLNYASLSTDGSTNQSTQIKLNRCLKENLMDLSYFEQVPRQVRSTT